VEWWARFRETSDLEPALTSFWETMQRSQERIVVWFGRHAAAEFAFLLACAERLAGRPYAIVDVTGLRFPSRGIGDITKTSPAPCVSFLWPDQLASLLDTEQEASEEWRVEMSSRWRQLKQENAPFRIVTATGLESAPNDVFDASLLAQATTKWKKLNLVVGMTLGHQTYRQVGHEMLLTRIVALIEDGRLEADGDPWDMRSCRVRLPV
jgi:hypothetical protein